MRLRTLLGLLALVLPLASFGQSAGGGTEGLHGVLERLYDEMMPLCSQLIGVGQGIAGFAATWYIASRVWKHIAQAEPIDFYPLFRPFVLGFAIMVFPSVLALLNGVLKPTVTGTAAMMEGTNRSIEVLLQKKNEEMRKTDAYKMYVGDDMVGDRDRWYRYTYDADPSEESMLGSIGNDFRFAFAKATYSIRMALKNWLSEFLQLIYQAIALLIDTLRTFHLVVLSILGPFVFGLSVFDNFRNSLNVWLARYVNIFLWLPVANIFGSIIGKIQEKMLELDIAEMGTHGDTVFSTTDVAYIAFLLIGIVGYCTVPSVANSIVNPGGGSALTSKVTNIFSSSVHTTANTAGSVMKTAYNTTVNTVSGNGSNQDSRSEKFRGNQKS